MAQPSPYARDYDFEGFQSGHPSTPLPGDKLNAEFDAVDTAIEAILTNLALIQRDDTAVANKSIGWDQLKDELRHGFTTPTEWATGTAYEAGDQVYFGRKVYAAKVAHTSGTFNTDYNVGNWLLLADFTGVTAVDQSAQESATDAANSAAEAATAAATATTKATAASTSETNAAASAAAAAADAAELAVWSATYDPNNVAGDAFDMDNMVEGADTKIMTAAERTKLAHITVAADIDLGNAVLNTATDASGYGFVLDEDDMASDSANKLPTQQSVNQGKLQKVASRTALKALDGSKHLASYLMESGREGVFKWDSSDLSTEVIADTEEGIYVAPSSDTTGASGAWVRTLGSVVAPVTSPAIRTIESRLWDRADLRDWDGLDLAGNNDNASLMQAAVNAMAGIGARLHVPSGDIVLDSTVNVPAGAKIEGTGQPADRNGTVSTDKYTYFHLTHTGIGFNLTTRGGSRSIEGLGTYRDQPAVTTGWAPTSMGADIQCAGVYNVLLRDLFLYNPYDGIRVIGDTAANAGAGEGNGQLTFQNIKGQPLHFGMDLTHIYDVCYFDEIHWWPYWSTDTNVLTYTKASGISWIFKRVDNPMIGRLFSIRMGIGLDFGNQADVGASNLPSGSTSLLQANSIGVDNCNRVILTEIGASPTFNIDHLYGGGSSSTPAASNLISFGGDNAKGTIGDLYGYTTNGALINLSGTGNVLRVGSSRSSGIDSDSSGDPEFNVGSGNTLDLKSSPTTTAASAYSGSGVINSPDWRSYPATITAISGTITTVGSKTTRFRRSGKTCIVSFNVIITTVGTATNGLTISLPSNITPAQYSATAWVNSNTGTTGAAYVTASGTTITVKGFPVADGERFIGSIEFEVA